MMQDSLSLFGDFHSSLEAAREAAAVPRNEAFGASP